MYVGQREPYDYYHKAHEYKSRPQQKAALQTLRCKSIYRGPAPVRPSSPVLVVSFEETLI